MAELPAAEQLRTYENQLADVELALRAAPGDEELIQLKADLTELVASLADLARIEQSEKAGGSSANHRAGDRVLACHEGDGEWHAARVEAVTAQGYRVRFVLGPARGESVDLAHLAVKAAPPVDLPAYGAGQKVSALYQADGRWYDATVQRVAANGTLEVTYDGYGDDVAVLEPEDVQAQAAGAGSAAGAGAVAGRADDDRGPSRKRPLQIPQSLEIKPDDTPEIIAKKKKRLHALKRKQSLAEKEEAQDEQRASWQTFVTKKKGFNKLTRSNHDPHFNPERDHQEMARSYRAPNNPREGW